MDSAAGRRIADRYRLLEPLARGAMGQLWVARDETLDRRVALKLIGDRQRFDEAAHLRFKREALATARLKSPHVVPVFDHGTDGDAAFIVMELLEGMDLGSYFARAGALALDHVVWVCEQVARGLTAAHGAGVLHRDLKPANLFLTLAAPHPIIKLLDFGIARLEGFEGATTATGELVGSPIYMSPEQAQGLTLAPTSDLFSLATILHNSLSGERAFEAPVLAVVFDRLRAVDIAPITAKRPGLPPALDGFFARAMQLDPAHRFQSAMDLYRAFAEAAGVVARPLPQQPEDASTSIPATLVAPRPATVGPMEIPGETPATRRPWPVVVGMGIVATGLLGIAGYVMTSRHGAPEVPPAPSPAAAVDARDQGADEGGDEDAGDTPERSPEVTDGEDEELSPEPSASVATGGASEPAGTSSAPRAAPRRWRPPVQPAKGTKPKIDLDYD